MGEIEPRPDARVARIEGSRAEKAIGALGWWLPETAAAGLLAALAAWAGWSFLDPVIATALLTRIAWAWPPVRRGALAIFAAARTAAAKTRRTKPAEDDPAAPGPEAERADEVAS